MYSILMYNLMHNYYYRYDNYAVEAVVRDLQERRGLVWGARPSEGQALFLSLLLLLGVCIIIIIIIIISSITLLCYLVLYTIISYHVIL